VHGGDPAWITFDQVPLDIVDSSFLCPTEATWTATYVLHDDNGNPTAVWVEPLP
jgi:hypothetical protein